MLLEQLREMVVEVCKYLYDFRLVGLRDGNVSVRDSETNLIAIKPSLFVYPKLHAQDVAIIDENNKLVDGAYKQSSESPMHTYIYRKRPEINGVIHCHAPYATAWSVAGKNIPSVIANQVMVGGEIPFAPYTKPGTTQLGEVALNVMGQGYAVILQNHGPLSIGESLQKALYVTLTVEDAAKTAYYALQIDKQSIHYLSKQVFFEMRNQ